MQKVIFSINLTFVTNFNAKIRNFNLIYTRVRRVFSYIMSITYYNLSLFNNRKVCFSQKSYEIY